MKTKIQLIEELKDIKEESENRYSQIRALERKSNEDKEKIRSQERDLETNSDQIKQMNQDFRTIRKIVAGESKAQSKIDVLKDFMEIGNELNTMRRPSNIY